MRFNTERDAWDHWCSLYTFHGAEAPDDLTLFNEWVVDNDISYLDTDLATWMRNNT